MNYTNCNLKAVSDQRYVQCEYICNIIINKYMVYTSWSCNNNNMCRKIEVSTNYL